MDVGRVLVCVQQMHYQWQDSLLLSNNHGVPTVNFAFQVVLLMRC